MSINRKALAVFGILLLLAGQRAPAADVVSIWGGARGTIVMKSDGTVWTWGANFSGKLGVGVDGTTLSRVLVPIEVHDTVNTGFFNSVSMIMGGEVHNIAVKSDGSAWAWGNNMFGQLGNGTTNEAHVPVQISGMGSVTSLGGRGYHSLAIKADGTAWAWGWNSTGELGNGTTNSTTVPVQVAGLTNPAVVSGGYHYSIALMPDGTVYEWGHGRVIGHNNTPTQVPGLSNVAAISGGWDHALALLSNGMVWAWGKNDLGEVGDGTTSNRTTPVQVLTLSNIVSVSGGDWHSAALDAGGRVWKWGRNDVGQLGLGTSDGAGNLVAHPIPARIELDSVSNVFGNIVRLAARDYHNIAIKADGSVWQWGANDQGQCGDNTTTDRWRPVQVSGLGPRSALSMEAGPGLPGSFQLRWRSNTGEYFRVEYTTNLMNGFNGVLQSNLPASPPTNIVAIPMTNGTFFYRLRF